MELVELLREVVQRVGPLREAKGSWCNQDPCRRLDELVDVCEEVIDEGLLIGRGL